MAKKVLNIAIYMMIFVIIILLLYSIIQRKITSEKYTNLFGYTLLEVVTGSMSGTIEIGDGVIVKLTSDIKEEDIIVYKKEESLITHRLIEMEEDGLITKGDANNVQDEPITKDVVIGKVIFVIPNIHFWKKAIIVILIVLICILYNLGTVLFPNINNSDTGSVHILFGISFSKSVCTLSGFVKSDAIFARSLL